MEIFEEGGVLYYQPPPYKDGRKSRKRPAARMLAKAAGEAHYFTGIPCKSGHLSMRHTDDGGCVECNRLAAVERYWEDPEKFRELSRLYKAADPERTKRQWKEGYLRHHDRRLADARRYYFNNRDARMASSRAWKCRNYFRVLEYSRWWRSENIEHVRLRTRKYKQENAERIAFTSKVWRLNNPHKHALHERARRARKANAEGSHTWEDVERILVAQHHRCAYCRVQLRGGFHIDHIMPLALGGSDWPENIQVTCKSCNLRKNKRHPAVFARIMGLLI